MPTWKDTETMAHLNWLLAKLLVYSDQSLQVIYSIRFNVKTKNKKRLRNIKSMKYMTIPSKRHLSTKNNL